MNIKSSSSDKKIIKEKLLKKIIKKNKDVNDTNLVKKNIIKKPWGFEYSFWSSNKAALWVLNIKKKQSTSLHCHLFKKTYLINLNKIYLKTLKKNYRFEPLSIIEIDKKTFHQTKNISDKNLIMFELEIPNQKFDLLRYKDKYKRDSVFYEKEILNDKSSINLKNTINKNFLEIFDGKKIKTIKKIKKNNILILISGYLKIENKKIKLFKPFKTDINLILKNKENFSSTSRFIVIKKNL